MINLLSSKNTLTKLDATIVVLGVILLTIAPIQLHWSIYGYLPYKECNIEFCYHLMHEKSKKQVIQEINEITKTNYKIVWRENADYNGKTNIFKVIHLKQRTTPQQLAWTYCHEIMHLKHETSQERFVQLQTFITLYESGIEYYKQVALCGADECNLYGEAYDFKWYAKEYLRSK